MSEFRVTRRAALRGAGALAIAAACAPAGTGGAPTATAAAPTAAGTAAATKAPLAKFNWLFGFTIQANPSMPVIVAKELGYYQEQSIDISWDFTTTSAGIRLIGTNQYQAGSVSDVLTVARFVAEGIPLKAVSQQGQKSARAFAVRKGEGISGPKDFVGKKVGIKGGEPWTEYLAMLAKEGVDRSKITEVPVGFSSVELKEKIVDVLPVFVGNEPFVLRNQLKVEIDVIDPAKFGFPNVGTVMVANNDYLKSNKDAFLRFLKATMKGQEYMGDLANRDKIIRMAIQYGGTATTKEAHEYIYEVTRPDLLHPKGVGFIDKAEWQKSIDLLADLKVLATKPKIEDLVDDSYMTSILKDGKVVWP